MTKSTFLEQLKSKNDSEILYLCCKHMIDKVYTQEEDLDTETIKVFFSNYKNYHRYLNDFAGVIYNRYGSHINTIYIAMCSYLKIEVDNKYTLEHVIVKLEKQTPELLLSLTNEDIQEQTIIHFDEKLVDIENSIYYSNNIDEFKPRVEKLSKNIELVKKALNL